MMVLGLLIVSAIPTTIGVCEALSAQKKANAAGKEKAKFQLTATVSLNGGPPVECFVTLRAGMVWLDHPAFPSPYHHFMGYYFKYPNPDAEAEPILGVVSTIADDPPMLNWIFADKDSGMLKHGGRQATLGGHKVGPWGWSDDERWLTMEGDDCSFVALEVALGEGEENRKWVVAWDPDGRVRRAATEEEGPACVPVKLHRKMQLGMDSRYVKDSEKAAQQQQQAGG